MPTQPGGGAFLEETSVRCATCQQTYTISQGVLSLLRKDLVHPESATEMALRDGRNKSILDGSKPEWVSPLADAVEVQPTLRAVGVAPGMLVNEIGCGSGRYTLALAKDAAAVIAVDFSLAGLLVLRQKLEPSAPVGLVQADVTAAFGAPRTFDRLLSTLHSNLPGSIERMASLQHVADLLKDDGRAVISMHHHGLRNVLGGVPAHGRYPDSGIYRCYLTRREAATEASPFFGRVAFMYIAARIPGLRSAWIANAASRIPALRSAFAAFFLAVVERPRRQLV